MEFYTRLHTSSRVSSSYPLTAPGGAGGERGVGAVSLRGVLMRIGRAPLVLHRVLHCEPTSLLAVRKETISAVHAQPDSRKGATPLSERQKALAAAAYLHSSRRGAGRCEGMCVVARRCKGRCTRMS